jgi:ferric-dicitrate binding protein FerR (iron transport regulator)
MKGSGALPRDPFEGEGAHRTRVRRRIEGLLALVLAIAACGVTTAMWLQTLAPLAGRFGLG